MIYKTVSVNLDKSDYEKLKKLSKLESRTMASYIRYAINQAYSGLTPLEKASIED